MRACVVKEGASAPLGATVSSAGVNFSVFSKSATLVELLLFDDENAAQPAQVIPLDGNRAPHLPLLACLRPRTQAGAALD
jgi:pullulanase/glycogen debranching enzyme